MKLPPSRWIIVSLVLCLVTAVLAGVWAAAAIGSLFSYRSPLRAAPPAPGQSVGQPLTRRVVYVLIDALRDDTSRKPDVMPFLNQLRPQGASATMTSRPPSFSAPGYAAILTGAWPDLNGRPTV